jgi:DNA-binding transcriptional MerR regulator
MAYTVKQLADMAGVSGRTLRDYDSIGLLRPSSMGDNGYRAYGDEHVLRLQQVLFYRELEFSLEEIRRLLDQPDFDMKQALAQQRQALEVRVHRKKRLIKTIDETIRHLNGETTM